MQDEDTGTPSSTDVIPETETPTNTELETFTPTNTESLTDIPTASNTETATSEYTETPTETPTLTETEIATLTETVTPTLTETETATEIVPTVGIVVFGKQMRMAINPVTTPTPTTYPFQCQGADVVQPLLGDSDMRASTVENLGDINGDGKPEIGIDASSSASPYKELEIFNGIGYGYWGYFETSVDPQMNPERIIGLGDIYGGDKVGEFGDQLQSYGIIEILSSYNNTGFVNAQTIQDPGSVMSYSFQSLGDINNDEYPSFATVENKSIIVYADTPPYGTTPYSKQYTITLSDYPTAGSIVGLPDIDGDGVRDFAVGVRNASSTYGYVIIYSGATGHEINRIYGQQTEYLGRSLTSIGDANGDGVPDILIGVTNQNNYYVEQYSLTNAGLNPKLIQQFNGGYQATAVTGAVKPGEADWIINRLIKKSTGNYHEMDLISPQGTELASCTPASGQDFGGMSPASTSTDGRTQFVLTLPKSKQAYVLEYLPKNISIMSPANWIMAQSLRPTFKWNSSGDTYKYRLEIHRTDDQGVAMDSVLHSLDLFAENICLPTGGICSFKPDLPSYNNSSNSAFELTSGTTLRSGGYAWKIISEDALGNSIGQSDYGYFQIPSLGGTWDNVRQMCNEPSGHASAPCISGDSNYENIYWNQYDDRIYRYAEQWDVPPSLLKAIMIGETATAIDSVGVDAFPPTRAYGFEPLLDCQFYVMKNVKTDISPISIYSLPHVPSESFCFTDKCRSPYDEIETYHRDLTMSIYDFVWTSGLNISDYKVFDNNRQINGCDVQNNDAQYRTSASYGLGQVLYINDFQGLTALAQQTYGNSVPNPIPPEWLYDPEFNINAMGNNLNKKRCACQNTLGAYSDTNLNDWIADVAAYNGWGQCGYGGTVVYRATKYTSPKSLEQGVDSILRENTSHVCDESLDKYANCPAYNSCLSNSNMTSTSFTPSTSSISFALSQDTSNQQIIAVTIP